MPALHVTDPAPAFTVCRLLAGIDAIGGGRARSIRAAPPHPRAQDAAPDEPGGLFP
jgi:hypothetical protein